MAIRRPKRRFGLSRALQEELLDAIRQPPSSHDQKPALSADTLPKPSDKRQLKDSYAVLDDAPSPSKRLRLSGRAEVPSVETVAAVVPLQEPAPRAAEERTYASFLKDFVDPPDVDTPAHNLVAEWLASLESSLTRDRHCRSDSRLVDDSLTREGTPVPRHSARSVPAMSSGAGSSSYAVPEGTTPLSTAMPPPHWPGGRAVSEYEAASSQNSGRTALVERPAYRDSNLYLNHVYMHPEGDAFPEPVADLVEHVGRDRDSPGPSYEQVRRDKDLYALRWEGASEPRVEEYFRSNLLPHDRRDDPGLQRSERVAMQRNTTPKWPTAPANLNVSNPVPDMLYGYRLSAAFTPEQRAYFAVSDDMHLANNENLAFPFFVVEFKGDGPASHGSLWVATNQCLGGSAACVNMAERLNCQLQKCSPAPGGVDSTAFSIAMNGSEAGLYVSWKQKEDDLGYYMGTVRGFLLQDPDHFIQFRKYVHNILNWGRDKRLQDIRRCVDLIIEENNRKQASEMARARRPSPPTTAAGGASPSDKRRRGSSRSRSRGRGRGSSGRGSVGSIGGASGSASGGGYPYS